MSTSLTQLYCCGGSRSRHISHACRFWCHQESDQYTKSYLSVNHTQALAFNTQHMKLQHWQRSGRSLISPAVRFQQQTPVLTAQHRPQQQQVCMASAAAGQPHTVDWQAYNQRWTDIWQGGLQKGKAFDKGHCSPQLLQLINSGELKVQGRKAFVPGCGRGYDVFAFALAGAAVSVGLDICPIAIAAAQAEQQLEMPGSDFKAAAAVRLVTGDFFTHSSSGDYAGPYDIGYDYTFLCALHPEMRQEWAAGWSKLLAPGGELLTMVYPVDPSLGEGPPWPVTPELYKQLLPPAGFELVSLEPIPHQLSHESRKGREWLGRWAKKAV